MTLAGRHDRSPNFFQTLPIVSCSMNRPTRVPASTAVRMNSASNMIAKWYQNAWPPPPNASLKICEMPTARVGAPPVREMSVSSCTAAAAAAGLRRGVEAEPVDERGSGLRRAAGGPRRAVHREVQALVDDAGGDERADGDERLHEHGAVADEPDLALLGDHLRRRPGGDQGVEAGQRPAGDGDEDEREQRAGEHRPGALAGEVGDRLGLQHRPGDDRLIASRTITPIFMKVDR